MGGVYTVSDGESTIKCYPRGKLRRQGEIYIGDYVDVECDKEEHLRYLTEIYNDHIASAMEEGDEESIKEYKGKIALANCILKDKRFVYTSLESRKENFEKAKNMGKKWT